jgi:two-component system KDP operon response regulator KdpE
MSEMQGKRILIVDDDVYLLNLMTHIFGRQQAQVYTAADGVEGLRQFYAHQPDLVLLDLMMPDIDGWQVCRQMRQRSGVPIIMLSALDRDEHVVRGLECGADDYITKPFSQKVLLARIRAALRRAALANPAAQPSRYSDGHLSVDLEGRQVLVGAKPVKLSPTEYELLAYLVAHADRARTYHQILEAVWGSAYHNRVGHVHVYISRLRQKIEPDPANPRYLLTEHGVGYRFERPL